MDLHDLEEQKHEVLALGEICGKDDFVVFVRRGDQTVFVADDVHHLESSSFFEPYDSSCLIGGRLDVSPILENPISVVHHNPFWVKYLPPMRLEFSFPAKYPSSQMPQFSLKCPWISDQQMETVVKKLAEIWEENRNDVILFHWQNFMQTDLLSYLDITDKLDISFIVPKPEVLVVEKPVTETKLEESDQIQKEESTALLHNDVDDKPLPIIVKDAAAAAKEPNKSCGKKETPFAIKREQKKKAADEVLVQQAKLAAERQQQRDDFFRQRFEKLHPGSFDEFEWEEEENDKEEDKKEETEIVAPKSGSSKEGQFSGTVSRWLEKRGFGFIMCQELNQEFYVHRTHLVSTQHLQPNDHVVFRLDKSNRKDNKVEAVDVMLTIDCGSQDWTDERCSSLQKNGAKLKVRRRHRKHINDKPNSNVDNNRLETAEAKQEEINNGNSKEEEEEEEEEEVVVVAEEKSDAVVVVKKPTLAVDKNDAALSKLIRTLVEYNSNQESVVFSQSQFNCGVCFSDKLGSHCMQFAACGHVFCKECMSGYFDVQITEGLVGHLTCPEIDCDSQALPNQVKALVAEEKFRLYERVLLNTTLETMNDILPCPRRHCQTPTVIDREYNMGQCAACQYAFCIYCKATFHGVAPCRMKSAETKKLIQDYLQADQQKKMHLEKMYGKRNLKVMVDNMLSETYMTENTMNCPKCQAAIQKSEGCNKMTCNKCGAHFCYLCGAKLPQDNPYSHFSLGEGQCFNRLFEGVDEDDGGFVQDEFDMDDDWPIFVDDFGQPF